VKIIYLPANGTLFWKGAALAVGAEIMVENGAINNFFYLSRADFSGSDSFIWNAYEGTFLATQNATISISVSKVNDAPVLSNIETNAMIYSLGDPALAITDTIVINDVDNSFISSATVAIDENFTRGDVLSFKPELGSPITATYNSTTGVLEVIGKDTRANYEAALRKVLFSSPVTGDATLSDKQITFIVRDSIDNSNPISRIVTISEVFPEVSIVNAFTPNGDGVNDFWDFENLDYYTQIEIKVFDRNSKQIFECNTVDCKWDGKLNGKELPPGSYLYTIYLNGGKRKYQGTVTILR
jgi:gliding motility-associated-like protein